MKQAMSFRLSAQSVLALTAVAEDLHITRTEVIEQALMRLYKERRHQKPSPLLSLFGSISDGDAECIIKSIKENRRNKSGHMK